MGETQKYLIRDDAAGSQHHHNPYALAGWLSIIHGVLFFLFNIFGSYLVDDQKDYPELGYFQLISQLLLMVIFIYIFLKLKDLLNEKYNYHGADKFILTAFGIITLGLIYRTATIVFDIPNIINVAAGIVFLESFGLILLIIGIRLINQSEGFKGSVRKYGLLLLSGFLILSTYHIFSDGFVTVLIYRVIPWLALLIYIILIKDENALKNAFALMLIFSGTCTVSIILLGFAYQLYLITYINLGLLFLRTQPEVEFV
ncbi:hypothetical protein ACFL6G_06305 [candidate division KSB1 bacterium]